jgi:hypothetical protein
MCILYNEKFSCVENLKYLVYLLRVTDERPRKHENIIYMMSYYTSRWGEYTFEYSSKYLCFAIINCGGTVEVIINNTQVIDTRNQAKITGSRTTSYNRTL